MVQQVKDMDTFHDVPNNATNFFEGYVRSTDSDRLLQRLSCAFDKRLACFIDFPYEEGRRGIAMETIEVDLGYDALYIHLVLHFFCTYRHVDINDITVTKRSSRGRVKTDTSTKGYQTRTRLGYHGP